VKNFSCCKASRYNCIAASQALLHQTVNRSLKKYGLNEKATASAQKTGDNGFCHENSAGSQNDCLEH